MPGHITILDEEDSMPCKKCNRYMTIKAMRNWPKFIRYFWICECGYETTTIEDKEDAGNQERNN